MFLDVPSIELLDLNGIAKYDNKKALRNRNGEPVLTARYLGLVLGTSRLDEFKNYVEKIKYDRVKVVRKLKKLFQHL